jgi:hypothetical protein
VLVHAPFEHICAFVQERPHPPQFALLVDSSTHDAPHADCPLGQATHFPLEQSCPVGQPWPQELANVDTTPAGVIFRIAEFPLSVT